MTESNDIPFNELQKAIEYKIRALNNVTSFLKNAYENKNGI